MSLSHAVKDAGWASEAAADVSVAGQLHLPVPAQESEPGAFVGVDIGGTKIHMACWSANGITESHLATDHRGREYVLEDVTRGVRALIGDKKLDAAVVGVPGTIDKNTGKLGIAPNLPGWDTFDVPAALARRLGVSTLVENDVDLAAYGEYVWTGSANLAFIALGTGIGFGSIVAGNIVNGATGEAGEVFDIPVIRPNGEIAELEQVVCGPGFENRYLELSGEQASAREILARLDADHHAQQALNELIEPLAHLIATVHSIFEPEAIVLGGGFGARPEILTATIEKLKTFNRRPAPVVRSLLGPRAGTAGALALARALV